MSRSLSGWQSVLLGLVVLVGLVLGAAGLFVVGSRGWFGSNALNVRSGFSEIRGVEVGTRVRIQGLDAGEVIAITPPDEPGGDVVLHLRIDGKLRHLVYASSKVQIVSEGMIGGKVVEIRPPTRKPGDPPPDRTLAAEGALLTSAPSAELADVLGQVNETFSSVAAGKGTLGKLVNDPKAYEEFVGLLKDGRVAVDRAGKTMDVIQRDAEALKKIPLIGSYIEDPRGTLIRPDREKNRKVFAETDLFEAGRAELTTQGTANLTRLGDWLKGWNKGESEVVVVSYADPSNSKDAQLAKDITGKQATSVLEFLKSKYNIHRRTVVLPRKVTALGMGIQPPPEPEREVLPLARVEVIVFVKR